MIFDIFYGLFNWIKQCSCRHDFDIYGIRKVPLRFDSMLEQPSYQFICKKCHKKLEVRRNDIRNFYESINEKVKVDKYFDETEYNLFGNVKYFSADGCSYKGLSAKKTYEEYLKIGVDLKQLEIFEKYGTLKLDENKENK
jgi:hypothetical protein